MFEWLNQNASLVTVMFTAVVAIATVAYALLTYTLVKETIRLREAETEPQISLHAERDRETPELLHLVLSNMGKGPAYSVQTTFDADAALVQIMREQINFDLNEVSFLKGLRYVVPGQEFRTLLSTVKMLSPEPPLPALRFEVTYSNRRGHEYSEQFLLDPLEFKGQGWPGGSRLADAIKGVQAELRELRETVTRWKSANEA